MIEFSANRCDDRFICSVSGHSQAAHRGSDIVCAAVSALTYLLYFAAKELDEKGLLSSFYHSAVTGSAEIDFTVKEEGLDRASFLVGTVSALMLELEAKYPEEIRIF